MDKVKNSLINLTFLIVVLFCVNCKRTIKEASILLFSGTGTSANDVEAIKNILLSNHLDFALVNSEELNNFTANQFRNYKLMIVPGGDFIAMGKSLTGETTVKVQTAVYEGLNYLGICAGGFLAGDTRNNSFNIAGGAQFKFYSAEDKGIRKTAVTIANAEGTTIQHYWEDGPQFSGWGDVVSKYPDGTPATVQGSYGRGWIVLTGVHPEAPESWRKEFSFSTTTEDSHAYTTKLIQAAMEKAPMTHF